MIKNSFVLLDGVGYKTEEKLWKHGILSWDDFVSAPGISGISSKKKKEHDRELEVAEFSIRNRVSRYFCQRLKARDHWRLYPEFKENACFLDIETTGLGMSSEITVVGLYDGRNVKSFVKGIDLHEDALREELSRYSVVLTFYGSVFDIPFIERTYPSINLDVLHIDLCFASRRLGLKGGLKTIERTLGIERGDEVKDIDGFEAVRLWRRWEKTGDEEALDRLVEYNRADVVNLTVLAETVYDRLKDKTFTSICG